MVDYGLKISGERVLLFHRKWFGFFISLVSLFSSAQGGLGKCQKPCFSFLNLCPPRAAYSVLCALGSLDCHNMKRPKSMVVVLIPPDKDMLSSGSFSLSIS
jgi:hypothetical protein